MNSKTTDNAAVVGITLAAAYVNFISSYGQVVLTTLAILTAAVIFALRLKELFGKKK